MLVFSALFVSLINLAVTGPAAAAFKAAESRVAAPAGFVNDGPAPTTEKLSLRIGLASQDLSGLEAKVYAVSNPTSPSYGKHLTPAEVNKYLAPTKESVDAVNSWLSANNLKAESTSDAGDWISLSVSVDEANQLFNTQYDTFTHEASGKTLTRTLSYSLPANLISHIDVVHPTVAFDLALKPGPVFKKIGKETRRETATEASKAPLKNGTIPAVCNPEVVTPECLLQFYNIPKNKAINKRGTNKIGITAFQSQWAVIDDLKYFLQGRRPDMNPNTTFTLDSINGGTNEQREPGIEANLDVQYAIGIANDIPVSFMSVGGTETVDQFINSFVDVNAYILKEKNRPHVVSTSYGWDEGAVSSKLNNKICAGFMALGAVGTSVIFASGDGGVNGGHAYDECTDTDKFPPSWPAVCPFVTAVGATGGFPEVAADFSSGGFSNNFVRPPYQWGAVPSYLSKLGKTYDGRFNKTGRAYPDISAAGVNFEINVWEEWGTVSGTSASAPLVAAMIGMINDRLTAFGRPPLGFLNPFLYANPWIFNDITAGSNPGCGTIGFNATKGWDPVTGLGTLDFNRLKLATHVF